MKSTVSYLFIFFIPAFLFAQKDSTKIKKLQLLTHVAYSNEELYLNPGLGFKTGKHTVYAGGLFWLDSYKGIAPIGFFAGYNYEPELKFKRLSTFLLFHMQQATYLNEVQSVEPQIGYGIKINLFNNLYLSQSFSVGGIYYWRKELYVNDSFFDGPDLYFSGMIRLGLQYDINLSKNKK